MEIGLWGKVALWVKCWQVSWGGLFPGASCLPVLTSVLPKQKLSFERACGTSLKIRGFRVSFGFVFIYIRAWNLENETVTWDSTGRIFFSDRLQFKVSASHNTGLEKLKWQSLKCLQAEALKKGKPQTHFWTQPYI